MPKNILKKVSKKRKGRANYFIYIIYKKKTKNMKAKITKSVYEKIKITIPSNLLGDYSRFTINDVLCDYNDNQIRIIITNINKELFYYTDEVREKCISSVKSYLRDRQLKKLGI